MTDEKLKTNTIQTTKRLMDICGSTPMQIKA